MWCCLYFKTALSVLGLLHSELVFAVMLGRDSGESESWVVESGEVSTEVKGWKRKIAQNEVVEA